MIAAAALFAIALASADPPVAAPSEELHIVRFGPGCVGSKFVNLNVAAALFQPMSQRNGGYFIEALNLGALKTGARLLFNEPEHFADAGLTSRFLAHSGEAKREVLEESLPVLVGVNDFAFQYPVQGHADYLSLVFDERARTGGYADLVKKTGRLVRYQKPGLDPVLALEVDLDGPPGPAPDAGALDADVLDYDRRFAVLGAIKPKDDPATRLYSFSRAAGNSVRVKARVDDLKAKLPPERTLTLHAGHALPYRPVDDGEVALCAETLAGEHIDGIVPLETDLGAGPAGLTAFATRASLPFVAANLKDASGARPFPRFRILDKGGVSVAVIGLVGSDALEALPTAVRAQWTVDPPELALNDAVQGVYDQLRRWPDVAVVISTAFHDKELDPHDFAHVDVVIEPSGGDLLERTETVTVVDREHLRGQMTSLVAPAPGWTVSSITASLAPAPAGERKKLLALTHTWGPLLDSDAQDLAFKKRMRSFEEKQIARDSAVIIPDAEPFIRAHPELAPITWGDRVLDHQVWQKREQAWSPFLTDPLWMQLVTNAVKNQRGVEVALAVNLKRGSDVLGALSRFIIEDWLQSTDLVLSARFTGTELMQIAARVTKADAAPKDVLFAAGLDAKRMRINGRAINPDEQYTVAYSESVAALPEISALFAGKEQLSDAKPPALHDVVMDELLAKKADPAMFDLLLDHSGEINAKVTAGFDELSLSGNAFRNSDNIASFAPARETRVSNPDLYQLGIHANAFFLYDSAWLASEWRALAYLDGIYLDIPHLNIPPNEQRDDVVISSELRLNKVKLALGGDDFPIIPFGNVALDTEFTSTPQPSADPTLPLKYFPHQWIVRETAGLVSYPGPIIREVRAGVVVQHDLSEALDPQPAIGANTGVHHDAGIVVGYKLSVPLLWHLRYDSTLDLRYLFPDGDDRPNKGPVLPTSIIDLALHMDSTHKLLLPITPQSAFFLFADVFVVSGKGELQGQVAWNAILGAGMQFQTLLKL